jgi:hypothetical protein
MKKYREIINFLNVDSYLETNEREIPGKVQESYAEIRGAIERGSENEMKKVRRIANAIWEVGTTSEKVSDICERLKAEGIDEMRNCIIIQGASLCYLIDRVYGEEQDNTSLQNKALTNLLEAEEREYLFSPKI